MVQSESNLDQIHKVDMADNNGNGWCSCKDFTTRCQPSFRQTKRIREYGLVERTRCKHINAVVLWIGNEAIRRTIQ